MELGGTIYNSKGKAIAEAQLTIINAKTGKKVGSATSTRKGEWSVMLPAEQTYVVQVVAKNYSEKREEITVEAGVGEAAAQSLNITLQ